MESIDKYLNKKIENGYEITGGQRVEDTYPYGNPENGVCDRNYFEDNCDTPYKVVINPGFVNWINGKRSVWTFPACEHSSDYN